MHEEHLTGQEASVEETADAFDQKGKKHAEEAVEEVEKSIHGLVTAELHAGMTSGGVPAMQEVADQIRTAAGELRSRLDRKASPYVMPQEMRDQIEAARFLGKPILVSGEPGTGKTALAWALAGELDVELIVGQCEIGVDDPSDLLYTYDQIKRMSDAFAQRLKGDDAYIKLGAIGRAFQAGAEGRLSVLLLDEIDKTDPGFEDALLSVLETMGFYIDETGKEVKAKIPPIIIMTSNNKRDFTDTFRRRYLLIDVPFPDPEQMTEIVNRHFPKTPEKLVESAIRQFYLIRDTPGLEHRPSTAELLDWIALLKAKGVGEVDSKLVHMEALLKTAKDQEKFGTNKPRDELLTEYGMPPHIINAINGRIVFQLKQDPGTRSALYTLLANEGITFQGERGYRYDKDYRPFSIMGTTPIAEGWLVGDQKMYDLLAKEHLIDSVVTVQDAAGFRFKEAKDGNELFSKGIDTQDREVYRVTDGRIAYVSKLS